MCAGTASQLGVWRRAIALLALCTGIAPALGAAPAASEPLRATIVRTAFGIPHITAADYRGLGFGVGYAYAQDNLCLLAETLITVRGERSRFFGADAPGPDASNLESDSFYRYRLVDREISALYATISPEARDVVSGYAAGYNRYLADTPEAQRPPSCRTAAWVRSISATDLFSLMADKMIEGSVGAIKRAIVGARPPGQDPAPGADKQKPPPPSPPGSNGFALGRDLVAGGTGLLVANPHFPWDGANRLYEMHLTIPGILDEMGATLLPFPFVAIGFNRDVAWTHTVSTGKRATFYELKLAPDDPRSYVFDGKRLPIVDVPVTVDVKASDGSVTQVTGHVFSTRFGPILADPVHGLGWSRTHAYAVRDAMLDDNRAIDQWLRIGRARNVSEVKAALWSTRGTPWVNTLAADRDGDTLYADMSVIPDLPDDRLAQCAPSAEAQAVASAMGQIMLDGSKAACDWQESPDTPQRGIVPSDRMPVLERTDYVLNSNDSFWLANAQHPLTGFSALIGAVHAEQGWRTRMDYKQLGELMVQKTGRIEASDLQDMILSDRNLAAETVLDPILALCRGKETGGGAELDEAFESSCEVLAGWDRKDDAASRGTVLFREIWHRLGGGPDLWEMPFDPADAVRTPAGFAVDRTTVRDRVKAAMKAAVGHLRQLGIPLDVALGAMQHRTIVSAEIPLNGGLDSNGVLNLMELGPLGPDGYSQNGMSGSSYLLTVTWNKDGPVAHAILAYGQSSEPTSPHYGDQTPLLLGKIWPVRPFRADAVARASVSRIELQE